MRDVIRRRLRLSGVVAMILAASLLAAGCGGTTHRQVTVSAATKAREAAIRAREAATKARKAKIRRRELLAAEDPLQRISMNTEKPGGPSGVRMPTGNLRGWKQIFADDFPKSEDAPLGSFAGCTSPTDVCSDLPAATSAKWLAYPDGVPDTWAEGRYTPSQVVSIHNGLLDFHLHTSAVTGVHEVAALVPRIPTGTGLWGMRYGAYVIRFRASALAGYEAVFQLFPDSQDGLSDGEIGFPAGPMSGPVLAWLHWQDATSETMSYEFSTRTRFDPWHTAVIEREPDRVRYILDGKVIATVTRHLPTSPMYWVLQTQVEQPPNTPSASVSGHVDFAWVTAYAWDPKR